MKNLLLLVLTTLACTFPARAEKIKLIIDAAHGGQDAGAKAPTGETESELCMQFATALQQYAKQKDIEVVMVRSTNEEYVPLDQRNTYKALAGEKAYFVSFHINAANSTNERGAEIIFNAKGNNANESKILANKLLNGFKLLNATTTKLSDKGSMQILRNSEIPSVIIQPGYISNEQDLKKLKDKGTQQEVAMLVVKSITE